MIDLSNNPASLNKIIPLGKLFDKDLISEYKITEIKWLMSIKPEIRNVQKYIRDRIRLEEIEVFSVTVQKMPDTGFTTKLLKQIHSKIVYPCMIILQYFDKYKISAWNFVDSKSLANHNIMLSHYTSSWIHEPIYSPNLMKNVKAIEDILLNGEGNIKELYDNVCRYILNSSPRFVGSKTHLQKILYDLTGNKNDPVINKIDVSKHYVAKNTRSRYQKKEYTSEYKYAYEYEDIWHTFMGDERIRKIIENRRYRDADDMIFSIDSKYEEQEY